MLNFNKLKFEKRKRIHFLLIGFIVFLQFLISVTWINENYNESIIKEINNELILSDSLAENSKVANFYLYESQNNFQKYLSDKDTLYLSKYYKSLNAMNKYIYEIANSKNKEFINILNAQYKFKNSVENIRMKIDSLINIQLEISYSNNQEFILNKFDYDDVLNSINIESNTKIDSVKKKGLFGRLGTAISGKTDIQKEKSDVLITMRYGKNVSTGNIEEQIEKLFINTNQYYQKEFLKLKLNFNELKNKDLKLNQTNERIVKLSNELLKKIEVSTKKYNLLYKEKFNNQSSFNKKVKTFSFILLLVIMIILTFILVFFTKLAFDYEKKIIQAKSKLDQNLTFKNRIIGMISHEIRSPLSIIALISRRLVLDVKDDKIKDQFKSIDFTTNSLILLSNQVLEFSKNENRKPELNFQRFEIKNELNKIITSLSPLLENKGNNLDYECIEGEGIFVESDLVKLHQLFYNIIGNANKFTNDGVIKVKFSLKVKNDDNLILNAEISDNGIGINQADIENIFDNYYQGLKLDNVSDIGVGLGLSLCKEIIELFEGNIEIQSKENVGTIVSFYLILKTA